MPKFSVGEKIRCVNPTHGLTIGKCYTVKHADHEGAFVEGNYGEIIFKYNYRFEKLGGDMDIKKKAQDLRNWVKPYEKYILIAALLIALDYFVFKGKFSSRIKAIGKKVFDKLAGKLDSFAEKI